MDLAAAAGVAIENARLHGRVQRADARRGPGADRPRPARHGHPTAVRHRAVAAGRARLAATDTDAAMQRIDAAVAELVVALDGSASAERSLEVADASAAAADLPLRLLAVRPSAADVSSTESYLARVARRAPRVSDLTVDIATDAAVALAAAVEDGALVVLATHARRALGEVVFGSVADRVLQAASRPVLLVGPQAAVPDPMFDTMVVPDRGGPRLPRGLPDGHGLVRAPLVGALGRPGPVWAGAGSEHGRPGVSPMSRRWPGRCVGMPSGRCCTARRPGTR